MLVSLQVLAQQQEVRYLSKREVPTDKASAKYFEVLEVREDATAIANRYTLDSVKVKTLSYKDYQPDQVIFKLHGPYQEWFDNGQMAVEANYTNNKLNGRYTMWHKSGQVAYIRNYRNNSLQDTVQGFYESGALRRFEVYENGKLVTGKLYAEDGKSELPFYLYEQMPEFKGGEQAMFSFIGSTIRYPKSAIQANASGTVYITFVVGKDGKIGDIELLRGIHPDLDAEAIRVIKAMPKWVPGRQEGKAVAVRYNIPIKYSFK